MGPFWLSVLDTDRKLHVILRIALGEFAWRMSRETECCLSGLFDTKGCWMCFRGSCPRPFKVVWRYMYTWHGASHWILQEVFDPRKVKTPESPYVEQTLMTRDGGWDKPRESRWWVVWCDGWHLGAGMWFTAQSSTCSVPWGDTILTTGSIWSVT